MIRLDFHRPLTALEIREPAVEVCRTVAEEFKLHVTFHQPQQRALDGHSGQRNRKRIGNGKHKNWHIDFQEDEPRVSQPSVVGRIVLKSPYFPEEMQFGGFDYGKFGELKPKYSFIKVHTPSELGHYRPIDPEPDLLEMTYDGLRNVFEEAYPRLFNVAAYARKEGEV